jgi:hypothetical protein
MGSLIRRFDEQSGRRAVFVSQGATLGTLISYYGNIESDRVAELYSAGNYRIWWKNRQLASGTDIIFIDEDRYSEAGAYATIFA